MPAQPKVLLTIFTEAVLEDIMIEELMSLGAKGYSISEARGSGAHGVRSGKWSASSNIRIEVVGDAPLIGRIVERLQSQYERDYGLLMFTTQVELQN
ncbi:MAG: transcriptional regulator [Halothiobacillaceae bacterium]